MATWWHIARGALAVTVVTTICWELKLNAATSGFLFLFVIVLNALDSNFVSAAAVSALAAGCLDYFFTPPVLSFRVADAGEWITLASFLTTSLVVTKLGASARDNAVTSERQRLQTEQIYQVTEQLLALEPGPSAGAGLLEPFVRVLGLNSACLFDGESAESEICGESRRNLAEKTRDAFIHDEDVFEDGTGIAIRRIFRSGKVIGAIGFEGLRNAATMAGPLAAVAAASIHRTRAFQKASDAAAQAKAEQLRTAILDALAHDFKTPLATILTAAGGLREVGALQGDQEELVQILESEVSRLGKLTSQFLRTAQLDREELRLHPERLDLAELVDDLVNRCAELWSEHRLEIVGDVLSVDVLADRELVLLVLNQLVDNACKYSKAGSVVEFRLERGDRVAALVVWSASEPIPPNEREWIFDRFYRGTRLRKSTAGTGLGLYVARKIARAHGGSLTLEPEDPLRGGTAFRMSLPTVERERRNGDEAENPDRRR